MHQEVLARRHHGLLSPKFPLGLTLAPSIEGIVYAVQHRTWFLRTGSYSRSLRMLMRFFPCLATFCLIALPSAARPAEEKAVTPPTLVVKVQSIDNLRDNIKYLGQLAGREREVE